MTHHPAFSARVRSQQIHKANGHGAAIPAVLHGNAGPSATKTKSLLHDSAFLAERGCLGAGKVHGHSGTAHQH
jgi:hypothetical protein